MTRSRWWQRYAHPIACAVVFACLSSSASAQPPLDARRKVVLALHVVRRDSPEFDDILRREIGQALANRLDYYSEYIDLSRLRDEKYQSALRSYLRSRYFDGAVDLVIASGPSVVDFLNRDRSLLQDVPWVFAARPGTQRGPNSTGITSTLDLKSTIAAALALQPGTKHVFVVSGVGPFDTIYADTFRMQSASFSGRVTFHELTGLALPDLEARVRHLPRDSVLFFLSFTDDGAGRTFMPLDVLDSIAAASNVPVYSWHEDALGRGIVGGRLRSSISDVQEISRLALRVLGGEKPETIPVVEFDSYTDVFDWRQLQRWSISEALLPPGSVIRFRGRSFFEQNRVYVLGGSLVVAAQFALIGGLLIHRHRRRLAEESLRQSETRKSAILRALPDLMFVMDRAGRYEDYHARDQKMLFVPPEVFLGRTIRDVMPPELAEIFMDALDRTGESDDPVVVNYELPLDGEIRHFEARLTSTDRRRVVSIVRDVTESKRALERNRALAGRLIVSQEEERRRIGRELHDDLSQQVALLNIEIEQIAAELSTHLPRQRLASVSSRVVEIAHDLSRLSHDLHPSKLQTLGLTESVRLLCHEISEQRQITVRFSANELPGPVDPEVALCLYRITQEALRNVAKHSQAREATVQLFREGTEVRLQIEDSGVGFDPLAINHAGLGLVSMRERVGVLKGHIAIDTSPRGGTRVSVRVPLVPPSHVADPVFESV
jgi:PAS domain S-box-containing protein